MDLLTAITAICYGLGFMFRNMTPLPNKWIPVFCAVVGGALACSQTTIDHNALVRVALGVMSGFSAVGVNQITKIVTEKGEKQ